MGEGWQKSLVKTLDDDKYVEQNLRSVMYGLLLRLAGELPKEELPDLLWILERAKSRMRYEPIVVALQRMTGVAGERHPVAYEIAEVSKDVEKMIKERRNDAI